jgi:MarR family transcriptional regulator, organic hydroperoxide resistance regulator
MKTTTDKRKNRNTRRASPLRRSANKAAKPARREAALEVLKKFRQVFRAGKLHFSAVEKQQGVTGAQLWAMWELYQQPGLRVTDLAAAMALHQSTVSNMIDKLLTKRLLRRDRGDQDGRVVRLYLTAAGMRMVRGAPNQARGVLPDALEHLPAAALRGLDRQLATLLSRMKSKVAPGGVNAI